MTDKNDIRIIVYQEDGRFIAQCLEFDICTQADTKELLHERMDCLLEVEFAEMAERGQAIAPAPELFHDMWREGGPNYKEVAA